MRLFGYTSIRDNAFSKIEKKYKVDPYENFREIV